MYGNDRKKMWFKIAYAEEIKSLKPTEKKVKELYIAFVEKTEQKWMVLNEGAQSTRVWNENLNTNYWK